MTDDSPANRPSAPLPCTMSGGCHCGAVRFRVRVRERRVIECNCSICQKKGYLHLITAEEDFFLEAGADALTTYTFGTRCAQHTFCKRCGVQSFYVPRSHPAGYSINLRCLDEIDLDDYEIEAFDGQNWEDSVGAIADTW